MITGAIATSILRQKAKKQNVANIAKAPYAIQVDIFKETLRDLDDYLDTSDLRKLTSKSLKIIRDDILDIIKGVRVLRTKIPPGYVMSLDGTLEELRLARDAMQVALGMFSILGQFNDSKSKKLFVEMRFAQKKIEKTLELLKSR